MVLKEKSYLMAQIHWSLGEDPEYPYEAEHEGHKLLVRLNDFPEAELYALIVDAKEITNFDDWPDSWTRPSVSGEGLSGPFRGQRKEQGKGAIEKLTSSSDCWNKLAISTVDLSKKLQECRVWATTIDEGR